MQITVNVQLDPDETLAYAPDAAAMQVLTALGGDTREDYCTVMVHSANAPGEAGTPPAPIEAP